MMSDLLPSEQELQETMDFVHVDMFTNNRKNLSQGSDDWNDLQISESPTFQFDTHSTYVQRPSFMDGMKITQPGIAESIERARILVLADDGVTTDDISPA